MKAFLLVLVTLAVITGIFFLGIWQKWWKNPFAMADGNVVNGNLTDCDPANPGFQKDGTANANCGTPTNGGTPGNGGAPDAAPPSGRSVLISANDLSLAPNPNGGASVQNQFFHKATLTPIAVAQAIHYVSSNLPGAPHIYWWYNNGHYTFIKTEAGTHYYQKSILPNEIKLLVKMAYPCYADWYLSGSKYAFDRQQNLDSALRWCIYKKQ